MRPCRAAALAGALGLALPLAAASPGAAAGGEGRERFDTRVFATVQSPGFPAYVHVSRPQRTGERRIAPRVYAGTFSNPQSPRVASVVREWTPGGTLQRSWTVPRQRLDGSQGVQVANETRDGSLVVLEKSTASVRLLDRASGRWSQVSRLRDLPPCADPTSRPRAACSPSLDDGAPIPNYASWGPRGLYVTDYGQAVIWRVPRRGGPARVWLAAPELDGASFNATGIVYRPRTRDFLVSQQAQAVSGTPGLSTTRGALYRIPVRRDGRPGRVETLWESRPTELPDGFGIGRSGRIHLALAGPAGNGLVVLSPDGRREIARFPAVPGSGGNGSPIPFDTPSNATFLGRRVLVANQSFAGTTENHAILDVFVGERGRTRFIPRWATSDRLLS